VSLSGLVDAGEVRASGLCNDDAETLSRARTVAPVTTLQVPLSLSRRECDGGLSGAVQRPEGVPPGSVAALAQETRSRRLLTGRFHTLPRFPASDLRARDDRFRGARFRHACAVVYDPEKVVARVGVPLATLAVACALSGPDVPCAIVETARAAGIVGGRKLWWVVDRVGSLHGGCRG